MRKNLSFLNISENLTYALLDGELISEQIKVREFWNFDALNLCATILKNSSYGNVIDIGAGFGSFSIPLLLRNEQQFNFYSFEPVPTLFHQLCTNLFINNIENIHAFQNIISSENCKKKLKCLDIEISNNHGSFSFIDTYNQIRNINSNKENVFDVRTLDSFEIKDVKLLKISVSGMENLVIDGAIQTIKDSNLPPIMIESWSEDWFAEKRDVTFRKMNEIGYQFPVDLGENIFFFKDQTEAERLQRKSKVWGSLQNYKVVEVESDIDEVINQQSEIAKKIMNKP